LVLSKNLGYPVTDKAIKQVTNVCVGMASSTHMIDAKVTRLAALNT